MEKHKHAIAPSAWCVLCAICAIYTVFAAFTPAQGDSLLFVADFLRVNGGDDSITFDNLLNNADYLRDTDNVRLPNIFEVIPLMRFSALGRGLLLGIFITATVTALTCVAFRGRITWRRLAMVWLFVTFLCPWRGGGIAFPVAYLTFIAATANLLFIIMLGNEPRTPWQKVALVLTALLACTMHEGWSVPMACGVAVMIATRRFRESADVYVAVILYALGALWLLSAPGMSARVGHEGSPFPGLKLLLSIAMPVFIAGVVLATALLRSKFRSRIFTDSILVTSATAWAVSVAIAFFSGASNPNAMWTADLLSIVIIFNVCRDYIHISQPIKNIASAAMLAIIAAFYANVIIVQYRFYRQNERIEAEIEASPTGTAYVDFDITSPRTTLLHPMSNTWWDWLHIYSVNRLNESLGIDRKVAVVPAALANLKRSELRPVPDSPTYYNYCDILLADDRQLLYNHWLGLMETPAMVLYLTLDKADGESITIDCLAERFRTPEGDTMLWIRPLHADINGPFIRVR